MVWLSVLSCPWLWLGYSSSKAGVCVEYGLTLLLCGYAMWWASGACQDPQPLRVCQTVPLRVSPCKLAKCLGSDGHSPRVPVVLEPTCSCDLTTRRIEYKACSYAQSNFFRVVIPPHSLSKEGLRKAQQ